MDYSEIGSNEAARGVLGYIARSNLKEGDRLPPERELAAELGISRRALRQVLARMELDGRIWRGKRNGTVLGRWAPPAASGVDRSLAGASPADIMECRLMLEPAVASLAAAKATEADLAKIENCLHRTAEVVDDESWARWDGAFHSAIAEATRNEVFEALIRTFNTARARPQWSAMRSTLVTPEVRRRTVALHRAIWEALRQRQPEEAGRAMRRHMLAVRDNLHSLFV